MFFFTTSFFLNPIIVPNWLFEIAKINPSHPYKASRVVLLRFLGTGVPRDSVLTCLVHRYDAGTIRLLYHGTIRLLYHNWYLIVPRHYYCTGSLYGQYDVNWGFPKGLGLTLAHFQGLRWVHLLRISVGTIIGFKKKDLVKKKHLSKVFFCP